MLNTCLICFYFTISVHHTYQLVPVMASTLNTCTSLFTKEQAILYSNLWVTIENTAWVQTKHLSTWYLPNSQARSKGVLCSLSSSVGSPWCCSNRLTWNMSSNQTLLELYTNWQTCAHCHHTPNLTCH